MANRSRRKRERARVGASKSDPLNRRRAIENDDAARVSIGTATASNSYIRELSGDGDPAPGPATVSSPGVDVFADEDPADYGFTNEQSLDEDVGDNPSNGAFAHRPSSRGVLGSRVRKLILIAASLALVATLGARFGIHAQRRAVASPASAHVSGSRSLPVVPAHAPVVATHAPAAPPANTAPLVAAVRSAPVSATAAEASPLSALRAESIPTQPTRRLTELLQRAVRARARGGAAASIALQAWLDAGGTDAQPVAQLAYWLGRRGHLRRASEWAERATTMNASSQAAWYVLGATLLDDPRGSRSAAFHALQRCAEMPGRFTDECLGAINFHSRLARSEEH